MRRLLFWQPFMVYISVIITHILHITNHAGPSVWAAIHVLHSGHFFSWDMGTPHDAILVFLGLWVSYIIAICAIWWYCIWAILRLRIFQFIKMEFVVGEEFGKVEQQLYVIYRKYIKIKKEYHNIFNCI